jgi:hypothetical protein
VRLVASLLIASLAARGQTPAARLLPWEGQPAPLWQGLFEDLPDRPVPAAAPVPAGALRVRLGADGALAVVDARGVIRLRSGLPGRPLRVWRDGGIPVAAPWAGIKFSATTVNPLFSEAFWAQEEPRRGLEGLLWIQDDGERTLSLVHPATGKVAFLPLPEGAGVDLSFQPAGLVASERPAEDPGQDRRIRRWILPWVALVPVLAKLAPPAEPPRAGTALQPFPREKGW